MMKQVGKILKYGWTGYWFMTFILLFLLFYPLFVVTLSREQWYPTANRLRRIWAKLLFRCTGLMYAVRYEEGFIREYLQKGEHQGLIYCPNHSSYLDIPLFAIAIPGHWRFMAKAELQKIPLFNIFFKTVDIPVERESRAGSFQAYQQALQSLEQKTSLVLFPEGGISKNPPQMLRFKDGPFKLAIEKQVPVVPVTFLDNWRLYPNPSQLLGRPGRTRAIVHTPVPTGGMTDDDIQTLKKKVYDTIHQTLQQSITQKEPYVSQ